MSAGVARRAALACVVSPNPADLALAVEFLGQHAIAAHGHAGLRELALALDENVGCAVVVEEALVADDIPALQEALGRLPPWSDLPLIVVASDVAALGLVAAQAFPSSGNVTLLERPLNPHTLASAVTVALRAAARQREVGELIQEREEAVKLRDEFLAMLAHELRNPLAPMRNAVHVMRLLNVTDPLLRKNAEILDRQVSHVVRMVDDLMDVARLERGKVVLQKERLDLNRVVASAVESCLHGAQERGHHVSVRFGAAAMAVEGDPVRLEQVVCNLVNNASKFSPEPGEIAVSTEIDGALALLSVQDRGVGFEPGAAEKLFDPFLQVRPTLARSAGGIGMGLTIVKRLAELHGGSVGAFSEGTGRGSRFDVRLPLARGAAPVAARAVAGAAAAARRRRVVIVEDNPDIRETMRMLFDLWGHDVQMASDGPSGVQLILRVRPDVALVDVGLPGLDGYGVAREVRKAMPAGSAMKLVALTGYGQPADRGLAARAGFNEHLLKPISPDLLQRLLA